MKVNNPSPNARLIRECIEWINNNPNISKMPKKFDKLFNIDLIRFKYEGK